MKLNIELAADAVNEVLRYQKAAQAEKRRINLENDQVFLMELDALNKASQRRSKIVYGLAKVAAMFVVGVMGGVVGARVSKMNNSKV